MDDLVQIANVGITTNSSYGNYGEVNYYDDNSISAHRLRVVLATAVSDDIVVFSLVDFVTTYCDVAVVSVANEPVTIFRDLEIAILLAADYLANFGGPTSLVDFILADVCGNNYANLASDCFADVLAKD